MKSYTDIEQSKKLEEILPIESADMYWLNRHIDLTETKYEVFVVDKSNKYIDFFNSYAVAVEDDEIIPAWSLAALLAVIDNTKDEVFFYTLQHDMVLGWMIDVEGGGWYEETDFFDNPVDACYEMIVKLHEQKML